MVDLGARIAAALAAAEPQPDALASLIAEAEAALASAKDELAAARARALDPLAAASQVAGARGDMFEAEFRADRLTVALDHLRRSTRPRSSASGTPSASAEIARVTAERDQLAEDLKARYPALVAELAELLTRIRASNVDCARFGILRRRDHRPRPDGVGFAFPHSGLPAGELRP